MRSFSFIILAGILQLCMFAQAAVVAEDGTVYDSLESIPGLEGRDSEAKVNCGSPSVPNCRKGTAALCKAGCKKGVKNYLTSVHNCNDRGGNAYLCLVKGKAYCVNPTHPGSTVTSYTENGLCFQ